MLAILTTRLAVGGLIPVTAKYLYDEYPNVCTWVLDFCMYLSLYLPIYVLLSVSESVFWVDAVLTKYCDVSFFKNAVSQIKAHIKIQINHCKLYFRSPSRSAYVCGYSVMPISQFVVEAMRQAETKRGINGVILLCNVIQWGNNCNGLFIVAAEWI